MAISQSGQTPDIISVIIEGREQGMLTLAITNDPSSPLAKESEFILDICAGRENAVAATKTYTAQLMLIAMLSIALGNNHSHLGDLQLIPSLVYKTLDLDKIIERTVERYRYMQHCVVLGRGFNYATAFEWSLKLKELAYIIAEPYSSADFQHGPMALVEEGFPVFVVAPDGKVFESMHHLLIQLVKEQKAELIVISNRDEVLELSQTSFRLTENLPEWLSPIVSIIPAQLFSYRLALAKGYDTEKPRLLSKVTKTY
jgi:glucosamine--fructose-6-phosphate aminotransferase (isomerizing)